MNKPSAKPPKTTRPESRGGKPSPDHSVAPATRKALAGNGGREGRLHGKVAIITGAAQGIGAAIARRFLAEDARVLLLDRSAAGLKAVGQLLSRDFGTDRVVSCKQDVTDPQAANKALKACLKAFGRCDILVNNAGITHAASFLELTSEDFDRVLAVNLKSYFVFGQTLARHWVAGRHAGVVINMSSVNAVLAIPDQIPYVISKGAVNQLTKVMAMALAPHDIRVNAIGPGTIATELARQAVMSSEAGRRKIYARTPMRRLGEPEEVASVALFLASTDASYMTGQTVYPDGGRLALNYTVALDD